MTKKKALTICQPYAHLIATGEKFVENRTWSTPYRGWLVIHAGKSRKYLDDGDEEQYPDMVFGAAVAVVHLAACVPEEQMAAFVHKHRAFEWLLTHEHVEGPVLWVFSSVYRLEAPVVMTGQRSLYDVEYDTYTLLRDACPLAPTYIMPGSLQETQGHWR